MEQNLDTSTPFSNIFKRIKDLPKKDLVRTGWHYTSLKNWKKIEKQGLKLYALNDWIVGALEVYKVDRRNGIFVWKRDPHKNPKSKNHVGNILYQLTTKRSLEVCLLEVKYSKLFQLKSAKGRLVEISHEGSFSLHGSKPWTYHKGHTGIILVEPVPPENIKLLEIYDVRNVTTPVKNGG